MRQRKGFDVLMVPAAGAPHWLTFAGRPTLELVRRGPTAERHFRLHITEMGLAYVERTPGMAECRDHPPTPPPGRALTR